MTKFCFLFILSVAFLVTEAQFFDNFSDGDYTNNPEWQASSSDFFINSDKQLQSANNIANAMFSITTTSQLASNAQWEFWIKLDFNSSSVNYVDVWLISSGRDLASPTNNGYFVRLGGTDDNISLFRKTNTGTTQKIIEGVKGVLNTSSSTLKIKVIRTEDFKWILLRDLSGKGASYRSEGEIIDTEINSSDYFGILIKQSTSSFFNKHFFDDFDISEFSGAPSEQKILNVKATGAKSAQIIFQNPLNIFNSEDVSKYHVNTSGNPVTASVDSIDGRIVHLVFSRAFEPGQKNTIIIDDVADVFGSKITEFMTDFYYHKAMRYDVIIDEVFTDPSPQIGLPTQKFLELKNVSAFPVDLLNWKLYDGTKFAVLPSFELLPDSFLIVTSPSGLDNYRQFGTTISIANFPSLNISGGQLALYNDEGNLIHAMSYDLSTYKNEVKKNGGFSLEMINTKYGCGGVENWMASTDNSGGTPGKINSVDSKAMQTKSINVVHSWLASPDTLVIQLNKTVDSSLQITGGNFLLSGGLNVKDIEAIPPFFNSIKISLTSPAEADKIYSLSVTGLTDCIGAAVGTRNTSRFGIAKYPSHKEIVINEILSEPNTAGAEYIELYNNSDKIIDANKLFIANRNTAGELSSLTSIGNNPFLFFPEDFLLLTKDSISTVGHYPFANPSAIFKMASLPSFPNDEGFVVVTDQFGNVIDEINYKKNWHFPLIKDKKGVSLERISYDGPSDGTNFHSASKDMAYGTPGIKNSQNRSGNSYESEFNISPEVFSPDNDGFDDFLTIYYHFKTSGHVTNIKIFDAAGKMVRYLEKNSLSGTKGYYRWDGLNDKNQKLPQGIYVIYFESFNENGQKIIHKKAVVLTRR